MTDAPVQVFLDRMNDLAGDVEAIAGALAELAADEEYFEPLIAPIDPAQMGGHGLHVPERGPRLFLMHRPHGVMSYVHSHGTWAIVAPVRGVETHRRFDVVRSEPPDRALLVMAEELRLTPGDAAAIVPPNDIHSHGHAGGDDDLAYTLIVTGDDQLQFARREYDLEAHSYRDLPPGDFGQLNLPTDRA